MHILNAIEINCNGSKYKKPCLKVSNKDNFMLYVQNLDISCKLYSQSFGWQWIYTNYNSHSNCAYIHTRNVANYRYCILVGNYRYCISMENLISCKIQFMRVSYSSCVMQATNKGCIKIQIKLVRKYFYTFLPSNYKLFLFDINFRICIITTLKVILL